MGMFCLGLYSAAAELLRGSVEGLLSEYTCHWVRGTGEGRERRQIQIKNFRSSPDSAWSHQQLRTEDCTEMAQGIGGCFQAAPVSQEQSSRRGSGGDLFAANTLSSWGRVYQPGIYICLSQDLLQIKTSSGYWCGPVSVHSRCSVNS